MFVCFYVFVYVFLLVCFCFFLFLSVCCMFSPSLFKLLHLQSKNTSKNINLKKKNIKTLRKTEQTEISQPDP